MKKLLFICIQILLFFRVASETYPFQNNEYVYSVYYSDFQNPGFVFSFNDSIFSIDIPEDDEWKLEEGFFIKEKRSKNYILEKKSDFLYLIVDEAKFLVLYYEDLICILVDCCDYTTYCGVKKDSRYIKLSKSNRLRDVWGGIEDIHSGGQINTSSFLQEKLNGEVINYDGRNKYMWQIHFPWCEGVYGDGKGEWIRKSFGHYGDKIVLLNGYVDPNHPDYFYKNGRIKDLKITTESGCFYYTLEDSPQLQVIDINNEKIKDVKLTIESVYRGKKYKDTALSFFCLLVPVPKR